MLFLKYSRKWSRKTRKCVFSVFSFSHQMESTQTCIIYFQSKTQTTREEAQLKSFPWSFLLQLCHRAEGKEGLLWLLRELQETHSTPGLRVLAAREDAEILIFPSHIRQSLEKIKRNELKYWAGSLFQVPINLRECTGQYDTVIWKQVDWDFLHTFVSCFR